MATYYVRTDGSDTNAGTGPATNQAWATITKAIGSTGIAPGDTLYIAPGIYRGIFTAGFTNPSNESQRITIAGNPSASQFTGVSAGPVILTNYGSDNVTVTSGIVLTVSKSFITIQDVNISGFNSSDLFQATGGGLQFYRCLFSQIQNASIRPCASITVSAGSTGLIVNKCVFVNGRCSIIAASHSGQWDTQTTITDNIFTSSNTSATEGCLSLFSNTSGQMGGVKIVNNYMQGLFGLRVFTTLSSTYPSVIQNCAIEASSTAILSDVSNTSALLQTYNVLNAPTSLSNISTSLTTKTNAFNPVNGSISRIQGWIDSPFFSPLTTTQAGINAGVSGNNPVTDIYGINWLASSTPTIGAAEYQTQPVPFAYLPIERNASTITIAPGSTSQSIELYLGATGLTASTTGLTARYNRTRTASVSIPLVARTIAQAWTAGGFAEVDATNMPGVYRLDLPDAALASGADDVTVVVRGGSGTNGAVMTIKLSSGGLTSAQTASAVWGALTDDHTTHGTYGWNVLRADQDSKEGLVTLHQSGGVSRVDADIHAIANDTDAATELKGALLHNGTDYISADLLTPVSAATSVHIGPYQLLADGLGADQPLDVNVGTATSIDVQVTDANGTGIDITGATVTAKVYNAGGTLVATYSGTATYADNGRLSFGLTTTVTNTSGTYTVTVTRTTGATDTQVFGPLKLYVRPV